MAGAFARTARFKLYEDGRFYDIQRDVEELHELENVEGKQLEIRKKLQNVHDHMPKWAYFAQP